MRNSQNKYVQSLFLVAGLVTWWPIHYATQAHRAVFRR